MCQLVGGWTSAWGSECRRQSNLLFSLSQWVMTGGFITVGSSRWKDNIAITRNCPFVKKEKKRIDQEQKNNISLAHIWRFFFFTQTFSKVWEHLRYWKHKMYTGHLVFQSSYLCSDPTHPYVAMKCDWNSSLCTGNPQQNIRHYVRGIQK